MAFAGNTSLHGPFGNEIQAPKPYAKDTQGLNIFSTSEWKSPAATEGGHPWSS